MIFKSKIKISRWEDNLRQFGFIEEWSQKRVGIYIDYIARYLSARHFVSNSCGYIKYI